MKNVQTTYFLQGHMIVTQDIFRFFFYLCKNGSLWQDVNKKVKKIHMGRREHISG